MAKHYIVSIFCLEKDKIAHSKEEAESLKAEVEADATLEGCRVEIQEAAWLDKHCPECNPRLVKPS